MPLIKSLVLVMVLIPVLASAELKVKGNLSTEVRDERRTGYILIPDGVDINKLDKDSRAYKALRAGRARYRGKRTRLIEKDNKRILEEK